MSALARTIPATSLPSVGVLAAGAAAAIVVIAVLCALMRRHAGAFPLLAVLTLPFRVPISADGRTVNLLVPLYLVIAAGTRVHLLPRLLAGAGVGPATTSASIGQSQDSLLSSQPKTVLGWRN